MPAVGRSLRRSHADSGDRSDRDRRWQSGPATGGRRTRRTRADPRSSSPAAVALPGGVEVVAGDFAEPHTLVAALRGVTRMHLVAMDGYGPLTTGAEILELARQEGVRRLTHLGHNDPSRADDDPIEAPHRPCTVRWRTRAWSGRTSSGRVHG
ncbi:hypothetical protein NKG94_46790 [Micromonospora sp. M12]